MICADADCAVFLKGEKPPDGAVACCVEHFKKRAESFTPPLPVDHLLADPFSYLIDGGQRVYWRQS
jgi:hypothetical protein